MLPMHIYHTPRNKQKKEEKINDKGWINEKKERF
jgi:hypothetical protein